MDSDDVVLVSHWESLARRKIKFSCRCTLLEFRKSVYSAFDEISDRNFRLYTLPIRSLDIKERNPINDENFQSILQSLLKMVSESSPLPALYVWSDEKNNTESPTKLPVVEPMNGEIESISKSSKESSVSRSQKDATNCKTRDHNTCLCCGHVGAEGLGMEAALACL